MDFPEMKINEFTAVLASKASVPGGGGASALCGALGAALAGMVCNLTDGKKKYAQYQAEIEALRVEAEDIRLGLEKLMDDDAAAFEPLSKAYSIPKDVPGRDEILEDGLRKAAQPPMEMLRLCCRGIKLHERLEQIGSVLAISDVGTGAVLCWAGMYGAAMNVMANTHLMKDREYAQKLNSEAEALMGEHWKIADVTYEKIWERLK